ncbi:hypothetical protein F0919_16570 [Taibaiella lutea]|uniref:XRE family transcriptional regulator n=1 Tax=Taibaiella lutea TaxID=2608001 RepID=A0A5M6CB85_9BACT|nr:hypothetical protein [Taibaiella lutea]KAA5532404.1 hypothetical protein F0919_16570 [Taibaiella lutea]
MENQPLPPIGPILEAYIKDNRTYKAALARALNVSPQNLIRMRKQDDLSMGRLWQLSHILRHNFIGDIAAKLPADYTGAMQEALAEKDKAIAALQSELEAMTKERDIYKDLVKR